MLAPFLKPLSGLLNIQQYISHLRNRCLFIDRAVQLVFATIAGLLLAKSLPVADFGAYRASLAFISILAPIVSFGLDNIILKELGRKILSTGEILGSALALRATLFIAATALACSLGSKILLSASVAVLFVQSIAILGQSLDVFTPWASANNLLWRIFFARISIYTICFILKIWVVFRYPSILLFLTISSVEAVSILATGWVLYIRNGRQALVAKMANLRLWRWTAVLATINSFLSIAHSRVDQIVLTGQLGVEMVAQYSMAVNLVSILDFVAGVINITYVPKASRAYSISRDDYLHAAGNQLRKIAIVGLLGIAGVSVFGPIFLAMVFKGKFAVAAGLCPIISLRFFLSLYGMLRSGNAMVDNSYWHITVSAMIGLILNLALNLIFCRTFGVYCTAYVGLISFFVSMVLYDLLVPDRRQFLFSMAKMAVFRK